MKFITTVVIVGLIVAAAAASPLSGKELIISTTLNKPFAEVVPEAVNLTGNARYQGFVIDVVKELSELLGFRFTLIEAQDGRYGTRSAEGVWNGAIGQVDRGEADVAVGDITMTTFREKDLDFTHPFMDLGVSVLHKKHLIPGQDQRSMAIFFPSANYTTDVHMTVYKKFENIGQLLASDVKLGLVNGGSTWAFVSSSKKPLIEKIYTKITAEDGQLPSNRVGLEKVKNEDFAFLMESTTMEYLMARDPCLYQIGGNLVNRNYGFVVKQGSPLREQLSQGILALHESGKLIELKEKWWQPKGDHWSSICTA
ncbi:Glutamate receptor ionotropic, kainate 3 [Halotydeus destructor]|nr:Glutamate receptor ionotropic, kainate 3 [Halotydeus destructor]